ncbi:ADP-ribosylglycohydrolase family protein [Comamonas sp. 4034]|uniref:ADP-ribosylglycohydrolase family protein n=1 Tax=Comamonas sp. 4034 TaxID=3156455 RepID=UPI003D1B1E0F
MGAIPHDPSPLRNTKYLPNHRRYFKHSRSSNKMTEPDIQSRITGSLLGLALGDALGAPYEGSWAEQLLWRALGRTRDGRIRFTDDTQMSIDLLESLLACGSWCPDDAAARFAHSYRWNRGYGPGAAKVLKRIRAGVPWQEARLHVFPQGSWGNGGAMRAPVMALWAGQLGCPSAVTLAREQAAITHAHELAQDGAALVAAAVHLALFIEVRSFKPSGWPQQVAEQAQLHSRATWHQRLRQATSWLDGSQDPPDAKVVARVLGNGIVAIDSCVSALYVAARFMTQDFDAMLRYIQQMQGDVDTIAAMAASIYGAARGITALPAQHLQGLEGEAALRKLAKQLSDQTQFPTFNARQSI